MATMTGEDIIILLAAGLAALDFYFRMGQDHWQITIGNILITAGMFVVYYIVLWLLLKLWRALSKQIPGTQKS